MRLGHGPRMGKRERELSVGDGYAVVIVVVEVRDFLFVSAHNKVIVF